MVRSKRQVLNREIGSDRLLASYRRAGAMLDVAPCTIGKFVRSGLLPAVHIGGAVRIPISALRKLAEPRKR